MIPCALRIFVDGLKAWRKLSLDASPAAVVIYGRKFKVEGAPVRFQEINLFGMDLWEFLDPITLDLDIKNSSFHLIFDPVWPHKNKTELAEAEVRDENVEWIWDPNKETYMYNDGTRWVWLDEVQDRL